MPVFETCRDGARAIHALPAPEGSVDGDDETVAHSHCYYPRDATVEDNGADLRRRRASCWRSGGFVAEYARGAAFVASRRRRDRPRSQCRRLAPATGHRILHREIAWRAGSLRGHRYQPTRATGRPLLLVPGVHASGIDEPRLIGFARELASMGHTTVTAELSDLAHYSVTARNVGHDRGCRSVAAPAARSSGGWRIGMMGISFAGGLSIVAAGRPRLRDRVAFVLSFGGTGTCRERCTTSRPASQPDGRHRPPHDYGVAIILLGVADRVVPESQAPALRAAILSFLEASRLDMVDKEQASREFAHARTLADTLPEPVENAH